MWFAPKRDLLIKREFMGMKEKIKRSFQSFKAMWSCHVICLFFRSTQPIAKISKNQFDLPWPPWGVGQSGSIRPDPSQVWIHIIGSISKTAQFRVEFHYAGPASWLETIWPNTTRLPPLAEIILPLLDLEEGDCSHCIAGRRSVRRLIAEVISVE